MHLLCMHDASNKKTVATRLPKEAWDDFSDIALQDKRQKGKQFEILVNEEKIRRSHIKGEKKK